MSGARAYDAGGERSGAAGATNSNRAATPENAEHRQAEPPVAHAAPEAGLDEASPQHPPAGSAWALKQSTSIDAPRLLASGAAASITATSINRALRSRGVTCED